MAGRQAFERGAAPTYIILAIVGAILVAAVTSGRFTYDPALAAAAIQSGTAVLLFAFAARLIGFRRLGDVVGQAMLLSLAALALAFYSLVVASFPAPLADDLLRAGDALLGFERAAFIATMVPGDGARAFWMWIYGTLGYTPVIILIGLAIAGHRERVWAILSALVLTAFLCTSFVAILPALGEAPYPYEFVDTFVGVRDGSIRSLERAYVTGIVTFPSMHAADAVILGVASTWLGRWGMPLAVVNALMFLSALTVGGHYLVDIIAGGMLGAIILALSVKWHAAPPQSRLTSSIRSRVIARGGRGFSPTHQPA